MQVSDTVKSEYKLNSVHKNLVLYFPDLDLTVPHKQIYQESMKLKESILENNSIEFVGCIASSFSVKVSAVFEELKNQRLEVQIYTDDTADEPITLFNGIVDSAVKQSNKRIKQITAYDELYTKGSVEVASWYKSLSFPITLRDFRDSLFRYIGLTQVETDLPNDDLEISRQYDPNTLQSLNVIKAICQINGAFGIINRDGEFEYRILSQNIASGGAYLPLFLPFHLGVNKAAGGEIQAEAFGFYKSVDYEEFIVKPVDKLTIRQSEDDEGVTYGDGTNNYIIQGNMFTYGLSNSVLLEVAENIYENVKGFSYHPFTSQNNGLPFLECGVDAVSYTMIDYESTYKAQEEDPNADIVYTQEPFYILSRELTGIQALNDSYTANGEEYQTEFITDLQTQIDTIKKNTSQDAQKIVSDYAYSKDEIDDMFADFDGSGTGSGVNFVSVTEVPTTFDENTVYAVQGLIVIE
jgi:hypothetical protein